MKTETAQVGCNIWQQVPTDDLLAVCRLLVKRADSPDIEADELEELRVVAAELRRRTESFPATHSNYTH
jgi:hypothetical protein